MVKTEGIFLDLENLKILSCVVRNLWVVQRFLNNKFDHKLKFVDWMTDYFAAQKDKKIIILGDMNIAPLEHDVWSHKQLLKIVSHTPIEVEKMTRLQDSLNFVDTHRHFVDAKQKLYSWWSYRGLDPLTSNKGRRLDHIWATPNLKDQIKSMEIYIFGWKLSLQIMCQLRQTLILNNLYKLKNDSIYRCFKRLYPHT